MSSSRSGRPAQAGTATAEPARAGTATTVHVPHRRLRDAAVKRGVPLATILVTVAVVVLVYLAGKLAYRIRDVLLMIAVAGFVSLILNPLVVALQRWRIRRRGWAVAIVAIWTVLVFVGLLAAFGYPLAHAVTHFSQRLPSYVQAAEHGTAAADGAGTGGVLHAVGARDQPVGSAGHSGRCRASGHHPGTVAGRRAADRRHRRSGMTAQQSAERDYYVD